MNATMKSSNASIKSSNATMKLAMNTTWKLTMKLAVNATTLDRWPSMKTSRIAKAMTTATAKTSPRLPWAGSKTCSVKQDNRGNSWTMNARTPMLEDQRDNYLAESIKNHWRQSALSGAKQQSSLITPALNQMDFIWTVPHWNTRIALIK